MVVQHNLPAMNSQRQLGINNSSTAKNLEKLSSGFKVNRAGDDAAGLAISEKMRGQIRGLDMATQNAENGVSLIQTAEGALNETHSILQRIRELAVQSGNGTYHDAVDRENLDKEVQALKDEVDRISSSTHYNNIKLLDGSLGGQRLTSSVADNTAMIQTLFGVGSNLGMLGITLTDAGVEHLNGKVGDVFYANLVITDMTEGSDKLIHYSLQIGDETFTCKWPFALGDPSFNDDNGNWLAALTGPSSAYDAQTCVISNLKLEVSASGTALLASVRMNQAEGAVISTSKSQLTFQIGANGEADQRVGLHVDNMSAGNLGDRIVTAYNRSGTVAGVNISTRDSANDAIRVLDTAINQISGTRAGLGAFQNRLEHTINNLGVAKENLQKAESSIRDVDMAKEMMDFTKNNILAQASQSMLAQANTLPQGILQLLAA